MPRKSSIDKTIDNREVIARDQIEPELIAMWGFNPYRILTEAPSIRRLENFVQWQCLNCKHIFAFNFVGLEELKRNKGYYCPKCQGTENPVNKMPSIDADRERSISKMKGSSTIMTVKEIVDLAETDKLVGYPDDENVRWDKRRSKDFHKYLLDGYGFGLSFILINRPDGIYEVFDGKQRVSLLFQLLEKCDKQETEKIEKMECRVDIITDATIEELRGLRNTLAMRIPLNEPEGRKGASTSEKNETVNKLLEHDFFKNCLMQGEKHDLADRDCVEILLAFCYDNFQEKADFRTLPSNLELFVAEKPPYDKESSYGNDPNQTLDLMNHLFSNTDFICRAVDFCYMAVLNLWLDLGERFREINEKDYKTLYKEYVRMWSALSPCVTLNPLAGENLEKVQSYFKDMVLRIFDSEYVGL